MQLSVDQAKVDYRSANDIEGWGRDRMPTWAILVPLLSAGVSAIVGFAASIWATRVQAARLRTEFATEMSAESAIRNLLELDQIRYRSFPMIRHHIGGFAGNDLRRLLVRAGAVRFMAADGTELWALRERVAEDYQTSQWKHPKSPINKVDETELFPAAFRNSVDF